MPFPPVSWWQLALMCESVRLDAREHYQKMSFRNRYFLAGPQGRQLVTIPLKMGRNQRLPTGTVFADNSTNWQTKHWRTIQSCYGRSPFFEYFADELSALFENKGQEVNLFDWCLSGIELVGKLIGVKLQVTTTTEFHKHYPDGFIDIRFSFPKLDYIQIPEIVYHQVFQDRVGFLSNCSVLDLLFCKGSYAGELLISDIKRIRNTNGV